MKTLIYLGLFIFIFLVIKGPESLIPAEVSSVYPEKTWLIDDFSSDKKSSIGSQWRMFTDRVMGGTSNATAQYEILEGRRCLRLRGDVSLENNGGFVQVALPLEISGSPLNASEFTGIRLTAKGNGETYHIHLRTSRSVQPWQYFGAGFETSGDWQTIDIPFSSFKPENLNSLLNSGELKRIAVVAIKKAFKADISVARLEFYR